MMKLQKTTLQFVCILLWTQTSAVFFHENPSVVLAPGGGGNVSFGFSLGYQSGENASLVIGAPLFGKTGRVFRKPIEEIIQGNAACDPLDIDFDALNISTDLSKHPTQHFYLGASIAATDKLFVTCSPLRTANGAIFNKTTKQKTKDVYGAYPACFIYDNSGAASACQHFGVEYLLQINRTMLDYWHGSAGWSSMIDKDNNKIIISKSFNTADLWHSTLDPSDSYTSLYLNSKGLEKIIKRRISLTMTNFGKAMTTGNYFDKDTSKTYYAFSLRIMSGRGAIDFFPSDDTWKPVYRLEDKCIGSMFGAALTTTDVTRDGVADLLVGAPAQVPDTRSSDRGAVHVYTKSESLKMQMKLIIWGVVDGARFGSTLSTNDVDGDSYPEIFISAPFEKSGVGALYILCGHEIYNLRVTKILISQLTRVQKIEKETLRLFGFSIQPVSDYNDNGSDELGVGAPGASRVTLFSGIRSITVTVTSRFPDAVLDPDSGSSFFTFSSCVTIDLPAKPKIITTRLLVKNIISGRAIFNNSDEAAYELDLVTEEGKPVAGNRKEYCRNISIVNAYFCIVNTTVSTVDNIQDHKEFNETWVTLSPQSILMKSNRFECVCPKPSCAPELTTEIIWSGRNSTTKTTDYLIGSSNYETVKVVVHNDGTKGCSSCAMITVRGLDHQLQCQLDSSEESRYMCPLDSFMGNTTQTIEIQLVMDKLNNLERNFTIHVEARSRCDELGNITSFTVPYGFTKVIDHVFINGSSIDREITDTEIQNEREDTIFQEQTYTIVNNQNFMWKNILMNLSASNKQFIRNFRGTIMQTDKSFEYNGTDDFNWQCELTLAPFSTTKVSLYTTILKKEVAHYLNGTVTIQSELKLGLFPDEIKKSELPASVSFKKEKSLIHNKKLIVIIAGSVALLLLIIVVIILYKLNFFVRKNKNKLQQEIRKRSLRRESSRRHEPPNDDADAETTQNQPCETVDSMPLGNDSSSQITSDARAQRFEDSASMLLHETTLKVKE